MANAALRQNTDINAFFGQKNAQPMAHSELKQAFHMFNEMSQQLTDSYVFLENKVEQLSGELASESAQKMQELNEKKQLADRLESLLELLPAGVLALDENGYVTQANAAAEEYLLPHIQAPTLLGQRWVNLIRLCFKPQRDDGHEISMVDGRKMQLRTAAMANQCGQLILLTDMTETRALQAQLSQHERLSAMGKMVASLAHQIRTPLSAATLYADHLASSDLNHEIREKFAGKLQERLHHLENQVRDMLIFARGEAPLQDDISVDDLLVGLSGAMEVPLAQSDASCEIDNCAPGQRIICNKDALISALMNLVNNALEAGIKPIELLVRVEVQDNNLVLSVMDNGRGMSGEQMEKIAEPFYTTKSNGTGLGLAVVQAVVRAHKGEFQLNDSPLGGVCASLTLPLQSQYQNPSENLSQQREQQPAVALNDAVLSSFYSSASH